MTGCLVARSHSLLPTRAVAEALWCRAWKAVAGAEGRSAMASPELCPSARAMCATRRLRLLSLKRLSFSRSAHCDRTPEDRAHIAAGFAFVDASEIRSDEKGMWRVPARANGPLVEEV